MQIFKMALAASFLTFVLAAYGTTTQDQRPKANMAGARFLDHMTLHHQQGIDMAKLASDRAQNPELKRMAQKMVKDHSRELDQMKSWRKDVFAGIPDADVSLREIDLSDLKDAEGREFDQEFVRLMVQHHDDGIKIAQDASPKIENKKVKEFAQRLVKNQNDERRQLAQLQSKMEGTESATSQPAGEK